MQVEIDPDEFADALDAENVEKRAAEETAREWYTLAQDLLLERGENYAAHGGRSDSAEVHGVVQTAHPPEWDESRQAWVFGFSHSWAAGFEYGTDPHTIEPVTADFLKFPWPDAPDHIKERFRPQWDDPDHFLEEPEVLLKQVEHPGTPALRFVRDSRTQLGGGQS